jgi:two-component system cell cycle response regulator DivK
MPVIAQTAFGMEDEEEKSLKAGCDGYISKPIRVKELFNILNKYLLPKEIK